MEPVLAQAREQCDAFGAVFRAVDVDSDEGSALAVRWGVTRTPTLLLLDDAMNERARMTGLQPLPAIRGAVERAYGRLCVVPREPAARHG